MSVPIQKEDSNQERISKLLPADLTAAFLSAKAGLAAAYGENGYGYVFLTFLALLVLCPFYFWFVTQVKNIFHIVFLCLTFVVFSISIADKEFGSYLLKYSWLGDIQRTMDVISTVLPILWVFVISRIFLQALGEKVEQGQ